jgi:polysaccharide export outer membrane protein
MNRLIAQRRGDARRRKSPASNRPRRISTARVASLLLAFATLTSSVHAQETPEVDGPQDSRWGQVLDYRIGPSDVLAIRVRGHEDLNQSVTIRPDGKLSLPLLGDLVAAGLTPVELQGALQKALGKYVNVIPGEVSVVVEAVRSYKVSVLGEVRNPGRFEFQMRVSVLDALAQAGGLTEFAGSKDIVIFRTYLGENKKLEYNYDRLVDTDGTAAWVAVMPGDVILVP